MNQPTNFSVIRKLVSRCSKTNNKWVSRIKVIFKAVSLKLFWKNCQNEENVKKDYKIKKRAPINSLISNNELISCKNVEEAKLDFIRYCKTA